MMLSALEKDSMDYVTADIPPGREYHFTSKIDPTIHAGIVVTKNLDPSLLAVTWKTVALNILVYEKAAAVGRVWKSIDQWMVVVGGRMFGMLWIKRVGAGAGVGDSGVATA